MTNYVPYFLEISQGQNLILAQFGAATIQRQLDFEGNVHRDQHAHVHTQLQ